MVGYLKRLAASLGAYQLANILAKVIAVVMLPLYTRYSEPRAITGRSSCWPMA